VRPEDVIGRIGSVADETRQIDCAADVEEHLRAQKDRRHRLCEHFIQLRNRSNIILRIESIKDEINTDDGESNESADSWRRGATHLAFVAAGVLFLNVLNLK